MQSAPAHGDPFSPPGRKDPVHLREPRQRELLNVPQPTAAPTVWLLTTGWRRWGPLSFDELGAQRTRLHGWSDEDPGRHRS